MIGSPIRSSFGTFSPEKRHPFWLLILLNRSRAMKRSLMACLSKADLLSDGCHGIVCLLERILWMRRRERAVLQATIRAVLNEYGKATHFYHASDCK